MVTVVRKDKPNNPNRMSFYDRGAVGGPTPPEPQSRFQRGVDMIQNIFAAGKDMAGQTGASMADYMRASSAARDGKFFTLTPNEYDRDLAKFPINQAYLTGELLADMAQIPFEAVGQRAGLDVGSGFGYGDIFFDSDDPRTQERYRQFIDDYRFTNVDELMALLPFQNYLRGQGVNVPDENFSVIEDVFNLGDLFRDTEKNPYTQDEETFLADFRKTVNDPESPFFVSQQFDQEGNLRMADEGMQPYYDDVFNAFNRYTGQKEADFLNQYLQGYQESSYPQIVTGLARELNISPKTAQMYLASGGKPLGYTERDMGLFNDMFTLADPILDYSTAEGQALFGDDPLMNLGGGIASYAKAVKMMRNMKNKLPSSVRRGIENLYPSTFGQGIPIGGKPYYPQLAYTSLPRGFAQALGFATLPEYGSGPNYQEQPEGLELTLPVGDFFN